MYGARLGMLRGSHSPNPPPTTVRFPLEPCFPDRAENAPQRGALKAIALPARRDSALARRSQRSPSIRKEWLDGNRRRYGERGTHAEAAKPLFRSERSTNACTAEVQKKLTWPPEYHWIVGRSQCSQSRRAWSGGTIRSPVAAKR